jgi:hypothetical protein
VLRQTVELALAKVSQENSLRDDLAGGMPLKDAFAKHGIL